MNDQLVAEFWSRVENHLVKEYGFPEPKALEDIELYRTRLAAHGVTDFLYHWEPKDIAKAIEGGGFRQALPRG